MKALIQSFGMVSTALAAAPPQKRFFIAFLGAMSVKLVCLLLSIVFVTCSVCVSNTIPEKSKSSDNGICSIKAPIIPTPSWTDQTTMVFVDAALLAPHLTKDGWPTMSKQEEQIKRANIANAAVTLLNQHGIFWFGDIEDFLKSDTACLIMVRKDQVEKTKALLQGQRGVSISEPCHWEDKQ